MSSFHMGGKAWSAPGNFSHAGARINPRVVVGAEPSSALAGLCLDLPQWELGLFAGWEWLKWMHLGPGPAESDFLLVFNALRSEQSPRNRWWYFSDSQLWWYHTDLFCLSPQLQVWWGGVLEVRDRDIKPETRQGLGVTNSQAGEKHPSICLWVKVPEKATDEEKK